MKKWTKWAVTLGAAAIVIFGTSMISSAATGWVKTNGTWFYYNNSGEVVTDSWQRASDGKWYYLGEDGAMLTNSWVEDGYMYYVNASGIMASNEWKYLYGYNDEGSWEKSWYWFTGSGKMVTNAWLKSADGKWYYLGEDGAMLTNAWIDGAKKYYVDANGVMASSQWRYMYGIGEEDAEEKNWFWFDASGKMAAGQKLTIKGQDYYFGSDGKMLTGWIDTTETPKTATAVGEGVIYTIKSGTRVKGWVKLYAPGDEEEDEEMKSWYYITSAGEIKYNERTLINNKTYVFDEEGRMLTGWIQSVTSAEEPQYKEIRSATGLDYTNILYAGGKDDGAVITAGWFYAAEPGDDVEDPNAERFWYYVGKDGTLVTAANQIATDSEAEAVPIAIGENSTTEENGEAVGVLKIGAKYYGFDLNGKMISGLWRFLRVAESGSQFAEANYYFGSDGAMKTGAVTLMQEDEEIPYTYYFSTDTATFGRGLSGVKSTKLYDEGLLIKANEDTTYGAAIVAGIAYIVNEDGKVMTGTSTTYAAANDIQYKIISGKVYYTTDGETPTVESGEVVSGMDTDILHYTSMK